MDMRFGTLNIKSMYRAGALRVVGGRNIAMHIGSWWRSQKERDL
jgi:hypothetical protein